MKSKTRQTEPLKIAADNWVSNHPDQEIRRMYGHYFSAFEAGAIWQKTNPEPTTPTQPLEGFTGGEWKYFCDNSHQKQGTFTVYIEGDGVICDLKNNRSTNEQEANAALIASAPTLYRENKELKEALQGLEKELYRDDVDGIKIMAYFLNKIKPLI